LYAAQSLDQRPTTGQLLKCSLFPFDWEIVITGGRMSILKRIKKAEADYAIGDYENALIQALIAVDGTSRKRYPTLGNKDRFEKLLAEDFGPNIGENFGIRGGYIAISYQGEMHKIEHIMYKFLRCSLLHEAAAPPDIEFVSPTVGITFGPRGDSLIMNYGLIQTLIRVVKNAPENSGVFS
jgi:hypothetical protein